MMKNVYVNQVKQTIKTMTIELLQYKLDPNMKVRRIYGCNNEALARNFANLFNGTTYEYLPNYWRIII